MIQFLTLNLPPHLQFKLVYLLYHHCYPQVSNNSVFY